MIYISAQPDSKYFEWQLELQFRNFESLGINKNNIHVLIGYDVKKGLNPSFKKFIQENERFVRFFIYADTRVKPNYTSSIRPQILKQHFEAYEWLSKETIFYHDSDILFSRIPKIVENEMCYVSDTSDYLDFGYLESVASEELIAKMLSVVGISKEVLLKRDKNTGGAQYVLNNIDAKFWQKVEKDSEELYLLMKNYNEKLWQEHYEFQKEFRSKKRGIQAWCSDMWAVLWNLWYFEKDVEISQEMDFSWPFSSIEEWDKKAIQHYSGNIKDEKLHFKKTNYLNYPPWYDDTINNIPESSCSFRIAELVRSRRKELDHQRKIHSDVLILLHSNNIENKNVSELYSKFIKKHISLIVNFKIGSGLFDNHWEKISFEKQHTKYSKILVIPADCLIAIDVINLILDENIEDNGLRIFEFSDSYKVDKLFVETFSKVLDFDLLKFNKGKMNIENSTIRDIKLFDHHNLKDINCIETITGVRAKKIMSESFNLF
ncbi:hypothetical protein [Sphingobacterium faecium]|jgi:hypothetical protein|uniref:hypothetical protein n=1 Tax=Sphingobacterium faecium TaxID=34087 RepID=UPI0004E5FAD6|nr:hypothetical protein [Sphingobacterium faecium]WGQ14997.1 hypothetical protein QG727_01010 [Sphingobacterium faecium]CDS92805.1 hypothetical protein BN1088_1431123 [Sphingobacterium sp. PM2-P1-29]SJN49376.1 Phage protein [Sphingobacterium faecium PCAi_F2.5]